MAADNETTKAPAGLVRRAESGAVGPGRAGGRGGGRRRRGGAGGVRPAAGGGFVDFFIRVFYDWIFTMVH